MRAGVYDRVSDDQDGRSRSVSQQGTANESAAQQAGWRVVARYADPDRSASRFARRDRDDWPRLLADVSAGRLDVVVLWESSRGDRKLTEWSGFLDTCRERGVLIHVTSHERTYDLSRARDWKTLADEGVSNAYASEETSLRIRRDLADAAARGAPHGRLAYGYRRRYDPVTRELIAQDPHPEQAPIVAEIITRISDGEAVSAVIDDLYDRRVSSPTDRERWARSTVVRLVLEGWCYISKRRHNGGPLLDGNWPPLVDEDVYWRARAVLTDPSRKTQASGRGGIRPGRARWLLSYVATCDVCHAGLSVQARPRAGQTCTCDNCLNEPALTTGMVHFYRCSSSRGGCAYAPVQWLDGVVADEVIRYLADESRWSPEGNDKEAQAARDQAQAERDRLADFEQQAIAGKISSDSFARLTAGIEQRIADLDQQATALSVPPALASLLAARDDRHYRTAARRLDILERWEATPLPGRRSAIAEISAPTLAPASRGAALDPNRVRMNFVTVV